MNMNPRSSAGGALWLAVVFACGAVFAQDPVVRDDLWVANGPVYSVVRTADTLYVGGDFTCVGARSGRGVPIGLATGSPWATFPNVNGAIYAAISDGAGGWYIGGDFTEVGGEARNRLARVLSNGTVDPTWNPDAAGTVQALALSGGKVYIGGSFITLGGVTRKRLASVDATTGAVSGWVGTANGATAGTVFALVATDSSIYAGGTFTKLGTTTREYIAELDKTVGLPTAWYPDASSNVYAIAVSGSTVYAGGSFTTIGGQSRNRIAALDASTGLATAWNPNAGATVYALAVSGSIVYAGGAFTTMGGLPRSEIAAIDVSTGTPTAWNPYASGTSVNAICVSGSTVYAGGLFDTIGGEIRPNAAALDTSTGLATAWTPKPGGTIEALAISGSSLYLGGDFEGLPAEPRNYIAAIDPATGQVTDWDPNANNIVYAIAASGATIYVGGAFTNIGGAARNRIAAVLASTGVATAWNPSATYTSGAKVYSLLASGSTVYAGGLFSAIGGQSRTRIAALDTTTGTATAWDPALTCSVSPYWVSAMALSGSTLYFVGQFTGIGGLTRNRAAAVDTTTAAPTSFDPNANDWVYALALSGSTVYLGGEFTTLGGTIRNYIGAVNASTGALADWNPSADNYVYSLGLSGATVYAGGDFTIIGGQYRNCLAGLSASTATPTTWDPDVDAAVRVLVPYGTSIYAGGDFAKIGGTPRPYLAEFGPPPTVTVAAPNGGEIWNPGTSHAITWTSSGLTGDVRIHLYDNYTKLRTLADVAVSAGTWTWNISSGETPQAAARIRIQSLQNTNISDYSDQTFIIGQPPSVAVTSPNGGEAWMPGTSHAITWSQTSLSGNVQIYLYNNYTKLRTLATVAAANGTWTWAIPGGETQGTTYRVRVQSQADTGITDYSDGVFVIGPPPSIAVTAPNGGEAWMPGSSHAIAWTYESLAGNVRISLYNNWTKLRNLVDTPVAGGSYTWDIPGGETLGATYRIRLQALSNTAINDYSDAWFIVGPPPSIQVTAPNGGESWTQGTAHTISWSGTSLAGNVRIYLYNNWTKLRTLVDRPASAGTWSWTVDEAPGTTYRIRVQSLVNTGLSDYGDGVFTIVAP